MGYSLDAGLAVGALVYSENYIENYDLEKYPEGIVDWLEEHIDHTKYTIEYGGVEGYMYYMVVVSDSSQSCEWDAIEVSVPNRETTKQQEKELKNHLDTLGVKYETCGLIMWARYW